MPLVVAQLINRGAVGRGPRERNALRMLGRSGGQQSNQCGNPGRAASLGRLVHGRLIILGNPGVGNPNTFSILVAQRNGPLHITKLNTRPRLMRSIKSLSFVPWLSRGPWTAQNHVAMDLCDLEGYTSFRVRHADRLANLPILNKEWFRSRFRCQHHHLGGI